ncbi:hypothetical protein [Sphaerisporangium dianthi]|uniref:Integral membrane protein n=1 Tax=Sphaerisporangium dianthi TaxID=1436120 RepID=A0ABV9CQY0_9ACTN
MPSRPAGTVVWVLVLLLAGSAGVALSLATAPVASEATSRDQMDSPYLIPVFLVLALLTALVEWLAGRRGFWWGLVAPLPFLVWFVMGVVRGAGGEQGLWPVGLIFLLVLALVHAGIALAAVSVVPKHRRGPTAS